MVTRSITVEKTAKKGISLCIETSFGFEVIVMHQRQAKELVSKLNQHIAGNSFDQIPKEARLTHPTLSYFRTGYNRA